jgi:predicted amidohydrolase
MNLNVTFIQTSLSWEDKEKNLSNFSKKIDLLSPSPDIIVLPEMFTTGFSMRSDELAETTDGLSVSWMKDKATMKNCVITGSVIIKENNRYFNRLIWASPDRTIHCYDKRHLFGMANEDKYFSKGAEKLVVSYKGWRVCPLICYDLRFPVCSRNMNDYDLLIYIANWPEIRREAWKILLQARAVENQVYVIGVNRVGSDPEGRKYSGDSAAYSPLGVLISKTREYEESLETVTLLENELDDVRRNLPFARDNDNFEITP